MLTILVYIVILSCDYSIGSIESTGNITMALTEFGKAVRMARIQTGDTLLSMAEQLGVSSSFLSGLETGNKKVSKEWIEKITKFFVDKEYPIENLSELAAVSNNAVELDGLSPQQKMLVAGFAKSPWTKEQLSSFAQLLEQINPQKGDK